MPSTKPRSARSAPPNGATGDVLTLNETAGYLRLSETEVLRLVEEQNLPARRLGKEWRFWKGAIQAWLSVPLSQGPGKGIWAAAGALQDDPYLEDMLKAIEHMRGRPATEGD